MTRLQTTLREPGWPELVTALLVYLSCLALLIVWIVQVPDEQAVLRGNVAGAVNGIAGLAGLLAACALRIRRLEVFGWRKVGWQWLLAGAMLGVIAFGASFIIEGVYFHFITEANTQADFQAAAKGGWLSLLVLLMTGAILTPLGEECLFRGVVANALNRYGMLAGVVGSALMFALVHGFSVIFLLAFMVGLMTAVLFRKTGSIWPGCVLHVIYNGSHLLYYSTL